MLTIHSNGSKWAGQEPDSVETLLEVLSTHTLDPSFENYGNFITLDPVAWDTLKPLHSAGTVNFFGNFRGISHVFNIDTDEPSTIQALTDAIRVNQTTSDYRAMKTAMQDELDATAKDLRLKREEQERARRDTVPGRFDGVRCTIETLCPDDVVRQCVLVVGHDGFCDGGVR